MNEAEIAVSKLSGAPAPLRLAIVTETYPPEINGVAMTLSRLVDGLRRRGHHVQLIRPRQGASDSPIRTDGFEVILKRGVPIPRYGGLKVGLPAKRSLMRLWTGDRPHVVHIATEGPLGWSALVAATRLKIAVSSGFHTNFHFYSPHYGVGLLKTPIAAYLRKFHNRALATLVPTENLRGELERQGFRNLGVVSRGVDTHLFSPARRDHALRRAWQARDRDVVAAYVGRLAPEKNLPGLLEAFAAMRRRAPGVRLVIVGDGPDRRALERRHPEIIFAGARTGTDLAAHYASADLFLFPSLTETFGNVTLEAMASRLAVVAYDYAAARQHVEHERSGLLAPFGDATAFAGLAAALANEPARIERLRAAARKIAEAIDWESVLDDFERVLYGIAPRPGGSHA
jgi:glycosyltransferase involved in cell wall biosynthesis